MQAVLGLNSNAANNLGGPWRRMLRAQTNASGGNRLRVGKRLWVITARLFWRDGAVRGWPRFADLVDRVAQSGPAFSRASTHSAFSGKPEKFVNALSETAVDLPHFPVHRQ